MNRNIEITNAAVGIGIGAAVGGGMGALVGAVAGVVIGTAGRRRLQDTSEMPVIDIPDDEMEELRSAMHLTIATAWAIRPMMNEEDGDHVGDIMSALFQQLVEPFSRKVTPYIQILAEHVVEAGKSGIMPEDSILHVKRRYGPRRNRKDVKVLESAMRSALAIQEKFGNIDVSRAWFLKWGERMGIQEAARSAWDYHFIPYDSETLEQFRERRRTNTPVYKYGSDDDD